MKKRFSRSRSAPFVVSIFSYLITALSVGAQILNGNFELGKTNFTSNYHFEPSTGVLPGLFSIHTNSQLFNPDYVRFGDHTSGNGQMMLVDGSTATNNVVWSQNVLVTPATVYTLSAWATAAGLRHLEILRYVIMWEGPRSFDWSAGPPWHWIFSRLAFADKETNPGGVGAKRRGRGMLPRAGPSAGRSSARPSQRRYTFWVR